MPLPQPVLDESAQDVARPTTTRAGYSPIASAPGPSHRRAGPHLRRCCRAAGIRRRVTPHCPAPQLCDAAARKRRRSADRSDPARSPEHRHHRHLHASDRADPRLAQNRSRQGDDRPLIAAPAVIEVADVSPPLRGRLPVGPWRIDAAIASARHRRHHRLPHRSSRRTPLALRPLQRRGLLLPLLQEPQLSQMPHRSDPSLARAPPAEMLPTPYFHVTVTVPEELRQALRANQRDGYCRADEGRRRSHHRARP